MFQIESIEKPIKTAVFANPQGEAISSFRRNKEIAASLPKQPVSLRLRSSQRHLKEGFLTNS